MIVEEDHVFEGAGRPLLWDIYRPDGESILRPAVIVLHGGGWRAGSRKAMAAACAEFVDQGFVAIAAEYRLLDEAPWPAPLLDVKQAVATVLAQSGNFGIAAGQVFLSGFSAGAHLALLAAAGDPRVAGVASFFAPVSIGPQEGAMLGINDAAQWPVLSPITHAADLPPTILFAGDDDSLTPVQLAIDHRQAMRAAGQLADLQLFSDLPHEFVMLPGMMQVGIGNSAAFFRRAAIERESFNSAVQDLRDWWTTMLASSGS